MRSRLLLVAAWLGVLLPASAARAVVSVTAAGRFASPVAVTVLGGPLVLINADTVDHNLVAGARRAAGQDDEPFCSEWPPGDCPLFWTPLIDTGGTALVQGLEDVESGRSYGFYCETHAGMTGTLEVIGP